jgi:tetratricopeptide (TPR) repeat protein
MLRTHSTEARSSRESVQTGQELQSLSRVLHLCRKMGGTLTPERWHQIEPLLHAALELPPSDRARYLAGACADDANLQREVQSLLDEETVAGGFLSTATCNPGDLEDHRRDEDEPSLVGRLLVGRFAVKSRIGRGGMGTVYLADDTQLRSPVAIKALRKGELLREARAGAALRSHPHIATVYDVFNAVDSETPSLIVMEFVDGESLANIIARGPVPPHDALRFTRDVADALAMAHAAGVVHCDLKPANLRVNRQRRIKVLDFGLARRVAPDVDTATQTAPRMPYTVLPDRLGGTPGYAPPEQVMGGSVDTSADMFSLGVVLFEMLTTRRPFPGDTLFTSGMAMLTLPVPRAADALSDVPSGVDDLLSRMLARDAGMRPSAEEVTTELGALLDSARTASAQTARIGADIVHVPLGRKLFVPVAVLVAIAVAAFVARDPLRRWFGLGAAGPPPRISLAILPFESPGGDPRGEYIAAGMTSVIGTNLSAIPRATVYSRAATAAFQKDADDYIALQRALGVTHVLKLSWRSLAPTLKLEARLYRPGTATPQSDETFEGDPSEVERKTLDALVRTFESDEPHRRFTSDERDRLRRLPTTNGAALMAHAEAEALLDRPAPDVDGAIRLLEQATTLDPRFVVAWATRGRALGGKYALQKDPSVLTTANEALRRALSIDPESADVYNAFGEMQFRTGDLTAAETSFRKALQLQPDFEAARRGLARVLSGSGRVDEAEAVMQAAIAFSRSWNNFFLLGTIDYNAGRYKSAADAFGLATQATPNNAGAYTNLGTTQYILGDLEQAVGNFEHAVRLGPTRAAYANLALAYYDAGRYEDALHSYEQALQRDPRSVDTHRNIGDVEQRMGRTAAARAEYEQAVALGNDLLKVNPRDVHNIGLVALSEAKLGRRADAERHAAEAVAVDSSNREAWQRSAEVHALLNQTDAAIRDLEIAVARGFEPRMARRDDELSALRKDVRFEKVLTHSPGNTLKQGARP